MPQELNSPVLIPQLLVGLVHLEAGCWVRSCRGSWEGWAAVWPWLPPGLGQRRWRWETGCGPDDRSEPAPGPYQKERRPSPVDASLRLGQWLEGLD